MARSKSKKREVLSELKEKIAKSKSLFFMSLQGLTVKEVQELRRSLAEARSECIMAKKTLIQRAFNEAEISDVNAKGLAGELTVAFGYEDEIAPTKTLVSFAKSHDALAILGGYLMSAVPEQRRLSSQDVVKLSTLPSVSELRAQVVGSLSSPLRGTVGVLSGVLSSFVRVLRAYADSPRNAS